MFILRNIEFQREYFRRSDHKWISEYKINSSQMEYITGHAAIADVYYTISFKNPCREPYIEHLYPGERVDMEVIHHHDHFQGRIVFQ